MSQAELRAALSNIVAESAQLLDERRFGEWIDLTAPSFRYRIEAYSHDIRRNMTWLDHDRSGMVALIELLPKHHIDGGDWLRQVSVGTVTAASANAARAVSSLAVFHTARDIGDAHVDGGSSRLLLVGRYHDRFSHDGSRWLLEERVVRLHTRQLGVGSHLFP
ncbi:MAG TPA: nuclear transport factor 2 family protein [Polyangiaceae bacterium]|jgi:methanesulfonate monooxygenase small subunit|nr:nuclear transport factor 2 family protein [Polyangiaceae bacterium]